MEAPAQGTTYYLDGLPLDRVEPISPEDQVMIEASILDIARRRRRRMIVTGVISATLVVTFLLLGAFSTLRGQVLLFQALTTPWLFAEIGKVDPNALRVAKEKWFFEGSRPSFPTPLGLFSLERPLLRRRRKPPIVILQPGNVFIEPEKSVTQIQHPRFVRVNTDSTGTDTLTEGGLEEIRHGRSRILGQAGLSALTLALSLGVLIAWLRHGLPSDFWKQLLLAVCVVAFLDSVRIVAALIPRGVKLMSPDRHTRLVRISVLSPAFKATADSIPDLEGALRQIEVVENGLLWTVDDRPAAWRIYGTEPVFIRRIALSLPSSGPALLTGGSSTDLPEVSPEHGTGASN